MRYGAMRRFSVLLAAIASVATTQSAPAQSTWIGTSSGSWSTAANWSPNGVPASGQNLQLTFGATTNAAMTDDIIGTLILNQMTFNAGGPSYSLTGNALAFQSSTGAVLPSIVVNSANFVLGDAVTFGNNLTVGGTGSLTMNGIISGAGSLNVSGGGTAILTNAANSYFGGTNIPNGVVQVASDAALGAGQVSVGTLGTLIYASTTSTSRTFSNSPGAILQINTGQTLTLNGALLGGGTLYGGGTVVATGGSVIAAVTTVNSAVINQTGPATFINVTNGGALTVAGGQTSTIRGFTNQGSGSVTVGPTAIVNASDFQSYGTLTINPAVVGSGQFTELVNVGTSPLYFNGGSRTFIGTPATAQNFVAGIDLHGQNLIVAGGVFVNNGFVVDSSNGGAGTATVIADYGATVKGAGFFQNSVITQNGGKFQAGNSPGAAVFGQLTIGPGEFNNFYWQINDAGPSATYPHAPGVAAPSPPPPPAAQVVSGWSEIQTQHILSPFPGFHPSSGNLTWTATNTPGNQFTFALETLIGPTTPIGQSPDGPMTDFDPTQKYVWPFFTFVGTYSGPTDSATLTASTIFDTSQFANTIPAGAKFAIAYDGPNKAFDLVYTPVPEPGTLALTAAGLGLGWLIRRRRVARVALLLVPALAVGGSAQAQTWTGASNGSWANAANWSPAGVPASGQDTQLTFGATTHAAMTDDIPGTFALNQMTFNAGDPIYSLTGNPLAFQSNSAAVLPAIVVDSANPVTIGNAVTLAANLTIGGAGSIAFNGVVSGAGGLTVSGVGIVTLGNAGNSFAGGLNVVYGTLAIASDAALGPGPLTVSQAGTLSYSANTTTVKSFSLGSSTLAVNGGVTLSLSGGSVAGGFLAGPGTIATNAINGDRFVADTSQPSATITSNSANDRFTNFTNGGKLNVAAGVNTAGSSAIVNFNGFLNQGSGAITIGAGSEINVANFQSYGTLTLNPATISGQITLLTNTGSAPLFFGGGSRTFIGTPQTAGSVVAGIDLHGQNLVIAGGFVGNNGFIADSVGGGSIIVDYGGLFGSGSILGGVITQNGKFNQAPGKSTFGSLTLGPGGIQNFGWQINDARGTPGPTGATGTPVRGWAQLQSTIMASPFTQQLTTGNLTWTATSTPGSQFNFSLATLLAPTPVGGPYTAGAMDNFHTRPTAAPGADDGNQMFVWPVFTYQGAYEGPTDSALLTADTLFDLTGFFSPHPGTFTLQLDQVNKQIDLVYTPVPEPGTLVLGSLAGLGLGWALRRRRPKLGAAAPLESFHDVAALGDIVRARRGG